MAGDPVGEFARRRREHAERRMRSTGQLADTAETCATAAEALDALPHERWRVLHDVPWPGRPRATIDHVVVGPGGVLVIAAKHWGGRVVVRGGVLKQDRYLRQGAVTQAAEAARAVAGLLRTARCPVVPVLCLVRPEPILADCDGVLVCSTATLAELVQDRRTVLADVQVQRLAQDLIGRGLPIVRPPSRPRQSRSARRLTYLVGALAALTAAVALVSSPEPVAGTAEELASWFAEVVDDVAG